MNSSIKKISSCNRNEINTFYNFLGKLTLEKSKNRINKIKKTIWIGFYKKKDEIIGISTIKQPREERIKKISIESGYLIKKNSNEYGYIYVKAKYRGLGITKNLYKKLSKKNKNPIYATTRKGNLPMIKLLESFGFSKKGSFSSNIDGMCIYVYIG